MTVCAQKSLSLPLIATEAVGPRAQASLSLALLKLNSNSTHSGAYMLWPALCAPEPHRPWGKQQLETSKKIARVRSPVHNEGKMNGRESVGERESHGGSGSQAVGHRDGRGHV